MICSKCGHKNPTGANFCSSCGAALSATQDDPTITFMIADLGIAEQTEAELTGALDELDPGDAMLFVKRGDNVGATYLIDTDMTRVGRNPDNEVFLDDVTVSRAHAEIRRVDGRFVIQDVGSLNGTYFNGNRIERADLEHGDEVQIGKFKLVFLTGASHR